ncbi:MAG: hypothetical protein RL693_1161 [Verrucomicrobiota bacterium]|jgi:hypothetical protein
MQRSLWNLPVLALALTFGIAGCRKPEKPKSEKKRYAEAVLKRSQEQMAVNKFAAALREMLQWRQTQSNIESESQRHVLVKQLVEKMNHAPVEGLPEDLQKAWEQMFKSWQALASGQGSDASLRESGALAARELNAQLVANGVIDIRF